MSNKNLTIEILINIRKAMASIPVLKTGLMTLQSTVAAVFRTTVVAGFFLALRSIGQFINNTAQAVSNLSKYFTQLNYTAIQVAATMTEGGRETADTYKSISSFARDMAAQTMYSAKEIQEGLYIAALAGFNLADSMTLTAKTTQLAVVGQLDFKETLNGVIGAAYAFEVSLSQLPQLVDVMTAAFTKSKMELKDFFGAMKYIAPIAVSVFGNSMDAIIDSSAALMVLSNTGLAASQAGTYLRSSMQRLVAPTDKATSAFARYGVNIYDSNADSQKFFSTLTSGQKALVDYEEKLNSLKQRQLDLVISGNQNSASFKSITEEVENTERSISTLKSGLDDVFNEFQMAGGKLKPLHEILRQISSSMPAELMTKLFGIRGGQALTTLVNQPEVFAKFREQLIKAYEESKRGESITSRIFSKMAETVMVSAIRIGNSLNNIFGTIWESMLDKAQPVMEYIANQLENLYRWFEANKGIFGKLFEGVLSKIKPTIELLLTQLPKIIANITNALSGNEFTLPFFSYENKKGITAGERKVGAGENAMAAILQSAFSLITATIKSAFETIQPLIVELGKLFSQGMMEYIQLNIPLFINIGTAMGNALVSAVLNSIFGEFIRHPIRTAYIAASTAAGAVTGAAAGGGALSTAGAYAGAAGSFAISKKIASIFSGGSVYDNLTPVNIGGLEGASNNYNKAAQDMTQSVKSIYQSSEDIKTEAERTKRTLFAR